ncbi:hypothetical protein LTR91_007361 [Friedmanniomyces endolithicus]|uniref:Uncharacterized protein n=1 Tax=Friedmanniomyces endolithicus TaxID=329885 RepID=A0AAN6QVI2_9PEZI|nr:hypothetical protein LTR94_000378 [Friedmanniomyces endolithicus]KAK0813141.1 hypothetical protein LTR75_004663 [Friedmanniomyces endolithicus]KAK0814839.1 hypothetical protein LTR59_000594 [Friedmanniomyces endolithicus]KAK0820331.1 hypothetical protein LTR38_000240 [Friedmanniomyces endolithicus]KAK0840044.1 hypothetical protein LTR03_010836 [Friedmanniomyces endolithicus]
MEKIKSMLSSHKNTESGAAGETTGTFSQEAGHGVLGKSSTPIAAHGLDTSGNAPGYATAHSAHGGNAAEKAAYRQEMTGEHGHEHGHHGHGHKGEEAALAGAGGIAATRGAEDLERDRRGYAGEGGALPAYGTHQHGGQGLGEEGLVGAGGLSSRGGATGLETNDPYMAAGQAGALPGQSGISGMDRDGMADDRMAGEMGGAGYGGSQQPMGGMMEGGSMGGMGNSSTGGLGGSTLGREGESMMGGQGMGAGSGVGQEGLIHGHHTTMTGEQLDPHLHGKQL